MGKHRTPQQLLAEALEKVKELQIKACQHAVASDPLMKELLDQEKLAKQELSKAMKWLDPEKGLTVRIAKLKAQITEAENNLANATEIQADLTTQLKDIQDDKRELSLELSANMELEVNG